MASILAIAGGALINALAFSGTNAAFSLLGDHGKVEMRRHNLAMEKLSKAREDWNREHQQRHDLINKTLNEQRHAKQYLEPCRVIKNVKVPQNTKKTRSNTTRCYSKNSRF